MRPLLVHPNPVAPEVAQALDLAGHDWVAVASAGELAAQAPAEGWGGGFFCPCHGSKFDLAGRVHKGVPAPSNLRVPPHRFVRDDLVLIGQDTGAA